MTSYNIMDMNIEHTQVLQVILQYLQSQGLGQAFGHLQRESGVSLNEKSALLVKDIREAKWHSVLEQLQYTSLPSRLVLHIYQEVLVELALLRDTATMALLMQSLRENQTDTTHNNHLDMLDSLCQARGERSIREQVAQLNLVVYQDPNMKGRQKRAKLASQVDEQLVEVPSNRLLEIIRNHIHYTRLQSQLLSDGTGCQQVDLLGGQVSDVQKDSVARTEVNRLDYGEETAVSCIASQKGKVFLGTRDGMLEVYTVVGQSLHLDSQQDLSPQDSAVTSLSIDHLDRLVSADKSGTVQVHSVSSQALVKRLPRLMPCVSVAQIHPQEANHLLTAYLQVQVTGLLSGQLLKHFEGHTALVTCMQLLPACPDHPARLLTGSADHNLRLYDYSSQECLRVFLQPGGVSQLTVLSPAFSPLLLVTRSATISITTGLNQVIKQFCHPNSDGCFQKAAFSPRQEYLYALDSQDVLQIYQSRTKEHLHSIRVLDPSDSAAGVHQVSGSSLLVVWSKGGVVYLLDH